ncbi:hypothetical protein C8Q76DRAFT_95203 [Earliella scabrosa]|nr:hypothetical protein C8Q76DRAFT_95203 [Earliella scabrosa]
MHPEHSHPESSSLFIMARSKLHSAFSGGVRDSCSLHRWVLLKNSIHRSHTVDSAPSQADADVQHVYRHDDEEARDEVEEDAFMFPDPHAVGSRSADAGASEQQWLDSLLEDLGDDDEDADVGTSSTVIPVDDDDEPLSPLCSPMSSSDDLVGHSSLFYHPPPIAIPYPVPYPPLHPPLVPSWLQLDSHDHDPLPYFDADDDVEDLPVPDHHCPLSTQRLSLCQRSAGGCKAIRTCTSTRTTPTSILSSWIHLSHSTTTKTPISILLMSSVPLSTRSVSFRMSILDIIVHYSFHLTLIHSPAPCTYISSAVVLACCVYPTLVCSRLVHVSNLLVHLLVLLGHIRFPSTGC